jgi:N-acetylglucosaminyl-diphospho-decaprenol L-rhamnosyltransferase
MAQVDIVIINWNSGNQLRECLGSIVQTVPREMLRHAIVVDNASSDNSLVGVEEAYLPLLLLRNRRNRGFAAACNQGAAKGCAEYILFLNPDARLQAGTLSVPLAFLSQPAQADVGICGIQLLDDQGRVARTCSRLPTAAILITQALGLSHMAPRWFPRQSMIEWDHTTTRMVNQVMGAFFLVRRKIFESLSGFDERFFVYFEEVDFSLRARALGWKTIYLADARAYHRGCGTSEQAKARRLFYSLQSRILYAAKHFSKLQWSLVTATTLLVEPWTRLIRSALRLAPREAWETIQGFLLLWLNMPSIMAVARQRKTI